MYSSIPQSASAVWGSAALLLGRWSVAAGVQAGLLRLLRLQTFVHRLSMSLMLGHLVGELAVANSQGQLGSRELSPGISPVILIRGFSKSQLESRAGICQRMLGIC